MRHPASETEIELLTDIDAPTARRLIESASDLALVLDAQGVVLQASLQDGELARSLAPTWQGRPWVETVTDDSREKIGQLMQDALAGVPARWRQVNHPVAGAEDLPVMYAALRLPDVAPGEARVVAFGRDLRSTVLLQHRLVDAQQAMERDYWRFREAETRYRNLFQTSPEAVLVVDGLNQKILEANPAAEALAGRAGLRMVGAALPALFEPAAGEPLQALLAASRAVGRRDAVRLPLAQGRGQVDVLASSFRQDQAAFMLVRLLPVVQTAAGGLPMAVAGVRADAAVSSGLLEAYARHSPDGLVFTDPQGRILSANRAFATLAQLSGEDQARGEMLDRWLGRTGVELGVLISNLRQRGSVGLFTTGQLLNLINSTTAFTGFNAQTFGEVGTETWSLFADFTYDLTDNLSVAVGGR